MAFNPGGTNYQGFLDQRRMADEGVTAALKAKGEREKQERIKKIEKIMAKLLNTLIKGPNRLVNKSYTLLGTLGH